eukprot:Blabericola_migrator_1__4894@NODE_2558_length_2614_cov_169_352964_g1598_i0_p2_GENE_NODE_2558_length_2614_cov_169_352964_g1598_i0NODE_2558_length_2614_cov_169_352964_g1598_i0_p2_ORF_typecomplete_len331_score52_21KAR9/PF08580_10/0_5_NODE_2558_length_2614_cov_169_352964_g1598_i04041396
MQDETPRLSGDETPSAREENRHLAPSGHRSNKLVTPDTYDAATDSQMAAPSTPPILPSAAPTPSPAHGPRSSPAPSPAMPRNSPAPSPSMQRNSPAPSPSMPRTLVPTTDRPWTSHPGEIDEPESTTTNTQAPRPAPKPVDSTEATAKWIEKRKQTMPDPSGNALVDQPSEDEAGRKMDEVFQKADEVPDERPCHLEVCHPLCHIRPVQGVTRTNQMSMDNPFLSNYWQDVANARCDMPDLPSGLGRDSATKLYHMRNGDEVQGEIPPLPQMCPVCREGRDGTELPPYGSECCEPYWGTGIKFKRLARRLSMSTQRHLFIDDSKQAVTNT